VTASTEKTSAVSKYNFLPGRTLARKYEVLSHVTSTEDGELYRLCEKATGIERTGKFFYPDAKEKRQKEPRATVYAQKLHKLRNCKILMHYRTQETVRISGMPVSFVVWDQLSGMQLSEFLASQKGQKLSLFEGLHLLHALTSGLDAIHAMQEYHGNIAPENIIIKRKGIGFQVKLINMSLEDLPLNRTVGEDIVKLVTIFRSIVVPPKRGAKMPDEVKLLYNAKPSQIRERLRNAGALRKHLESMLWS
jgi:serine/threonine protein kinase